MLSFLLCLEIQSSQSSKVLFADSLVDGGATADTFTIVMGRVRPPISLHLDVTENHVLYWCWETRYLGKYYEIGILD